MSPPTQAARSTGEAAYHRAFDTRNVQEVLDSPRLGDGPKEEYGN